MTYTSGTQGATGTPAATFAATMNTALLAGGFTFVETVTVSTQTTPIYKSPAASNSFGSDWYLGLWRGSDAAVSLKLAVAEVWDTGTHKYRNYAPNPATFTPTSAFAVNDAAGQAPGSTYGGVANGGVTLAATGYQYWISVHPNRVVVGTRVGSTDYGSYAGLYDDLLPVAISPFPLCVVTLATGSGQNTASGAATREPGTTTSTATYCFGACVSTTAGPWGPATAAADLYQGKAITARLGLYSSRANITLLTGANGLRGLLKDVVYCPIAAANGDTLAVTDPAGTTRNYVRLTETGSTCHSWVDTGI